MTLDPKQIVLIADIPPIPHLLQKIMLLTDDPKTTSQKLESLVIQEPALVTKILKSVNSALYSFPSKINSVRHAMIILGFATVKSIASGLALMNAFENIPGIDKNYVLNIWRHGLKSAHYAKL
ncbi:MAG: metal dependent phosphohydrolase, partial [uncultured bacterium]